jgi:hypothetical protein
VVLAVRVVLAVPVAVIVRPLQATFQPVAVLVIVRRALAISPLVAAVLVVLVPVLSQPVAVVAGNGSTTQNIAKGFPIETTPQTKNTTDHQPAMSPVTIHSEGATEMAAQVPAHATSVGTARVRVTLVETVQALAISAGPIDRVRVTTREARAIPAHLVA